jgi:transposase
MQELQALQPPERHDQPVPRHPNAGKEKAIKARGDEAGRLALWRFSGVDLTRIDGISAGIAQIVLTEIGASVASFPSEDHFASWLRLCPRTPIARHKGGAVAVFAIARKLAQLIYRMLRYGQDYVDIGEKAYEAQFEARRLASLKEAARGLGYALVQEPLAEG